MIIEYQGKTYASTHVAFSGASKPPSVQLMQTMTPLSFDGEVAQQIIDINTQTPASHITHVSVGANGKVQNLGPLPRIRAA